MKKAVYRNKKTGSMTDVIIFDHEDFVNGNEAIPLYVRPRMNENDRYEPIQVNSVGGYCSHIEGEDWGDLEFVEYRYPETPYDEVLSFEEKVSKNNQSFDCGWISPEGDTYWCEPREHSSLADKISEELFDEWNGESSLETRGWVKVYHESEIDDKLSSFFPEGIFYVENNNVPTEKQLAVIKKLGRFTEEFKDYLRIRKGI